MPPGGLLSVIRYDGSIRIQLVSLSLSVYRRPQFGAARGVVVQMRQFQNRDPLSVGPVDGGTRGSHPPTTR